MKVYSICISSVTGSMSSCNVWLELYIRLLRCTGIGYVSSGVNRIMGNAFNKVSIL